MNNTQPVKIPVPPLKKHTILVFLTAMSCLMLELFLSRMASFHLGQSYAYLAIPITFLGLAIGGLHVHLSRGRIVENFSVPRHVMALLVLTVVSMVILFAVYRFIPISYEAHTRNASAGQLAKTLAFIAVNLGPFYVIGRILSAVYFINRKNIGAIYSADLWGAALACFITPVIFHFFDLPDVLLVCMAGLVVLFVVFQKSRKRVRIATSIGLVVGIIGIRLFIAQVENGVNFSHFKNRNYVLEPVRHSWNEFSRVTLLRVTSKRNKRVNYQIVHDNGLSNVSVKRYSPARAERPRPQPTKYSAFDVSFLLKRQTDNILVMFAGCGAEMLQFNELASGKANITGVEINPLVKELAERSPELKGYRLKEFFDLPNINLVIKEGRHFLEEDEGQYDVIFMGRDAATGVHLTAHSRKYLDTVEAYQKYLEHLSENGLLVFYNKPLAKRLLTLRAAHNQLGKTRFENKIVILNNLESFYDMLYSESGFSNEDVALLEKAARRGRYRVVYAPGRENRHQRWVNLVNGVDNDGVGVMNDDIPFLSGLDVSSYTFTPPEGSGAFLSWAKISTLLIVTLVTLLLLHVVCIRRDTRPPLSVLVYLFITGFCYMLTEIALMAKLELFLKDPLLCMATVLSVFLIAGGVGSRLVSRLFSRVDMYLVPFVAAVLVFGSIYLFDFMNVDLGTLPIAAKLALAAIAVFPVGVILGLFYPYLVSFLVANKMDHVVPLTYGISTLSSVIGVTFAMTEMLEYGFNNLLYQAMIGYVVLGLLILVYVALFRMNRHLA